MEDYIAQAWGEWKDIQSRRTPGHSYDQALVIERDQANWELKWFSRGKWDIAALYFQIEKRKRELTNMVENFSAIVHPEVQNPSILNEFRELAALADQFGVMRRPAIPSGGGTLPQAIGWMDQLQLALAEYSHNQASAKNNVSSEPEPMKPPVATKMTRALYDSGHDETKGEWTAPLTLKQIGKAISKPGNRKTIEPLFRSTGLKQKSREQWIVNLKGLPAKFSDAIFEIENKSANS